MRRSLGLLAIVLLICSGCSLDMTDDDPVDGGNAAHEGVAIVSPTPGLEYERHYRWILADSTDSCSGRWERADTLGLMAMVTADVPGDVQSVQVYRSGSYGGTDLQQYGTPYYPGSGMFGAAYYNDYYDSPYSYEYSGTRTYWFCVRVRAGNGAYWISPAVSFRITTILDSLPAAPPPLPLPTELYESPSSPYNDRGIDLAFGWCTRLPNVRAYLSFWNSFDNTTHVDTFNAYNQNTRWFHDYLPLTTYGVSVISENAYGISPSSDTLWLETGLPPIPAYLRATIQLPEDRVRLCWNAIRICDSLLVARREDNGDWETRFRHDPHSGYRDCYDDTTVAPNIDYFYRVGVRYRNGTFWSAESLHVRIG